MTNKPGTTMDPKEAFITTDIDIASKLARAVGHPAMVSIIGHTPDTFELAYVIRLGKSFVAKQTTKS